MRHQIRPAGLVLFSLCSAVGCAPAGEEQVAVLADSQHEDDLFTAIPSLVDRILSGFDKPDTAADWRIGDRILFGLSIERHGGRTIRFILVELKSGVLHPDRDVIIRRAGAPRTDGENLARASHITLSAKDDEALVGRLSGRHWSLTTTFPDGAGGERNVRRESDSIFVAVYVFDETGRKLGTSGTLAPEAYLRHGFHAACAASFRSKASGPATRTIPHEVFADVLPSLYGFGQTLGRTPCLASIMKAVAPRPSFWQILTRGPRISFSVTAGLGEVALEDRAFLAVRGSPKGYTFPIEVNICDAPALRCSLSVVQPSPPFHLCAGVTGLDGLHVRDPDRRFSLRLLAARRGPP